MPTKRRPFLPGYRKLRYKIRTFLRSSWKPQKYVHWAKSLHHSLKWADSTAGICSNILVIKYKAFREKGFFVAFFLLLVGCIISLFVFEILFLLVVLF